MDFKFKNIDELIRERILNRADLVIEGAIGGYAPSAFYLYKKFRKNGYRGYGTPYVGVNLGKMPATVPKGLRYVEKTDALDPDAMNAITEKYKSEDPFFVTNCCEVIFFETSSMTDNFLKATNDVTYSMQMHRQFGGFNPRRLDYLIKASKEFGWETSLQSREVVVMESV